MGWLRKNGHSTSLREGGCRAGGPHANRGLNYLVSAHRPKTASCGFVSAPVVSLASSNCSAHHRYPATDPALQVFAACFECTAQSVCELVNRYKHPILLPTICPHLLPCLFTTPCRTACVWQPCVAPPLASSLTLLVTLFLPPQHTHSHTLSHTHTLTLTLPVCVTWLS